MTPRTDTPYRIDDAWSKAILSVRTAAALGFLKPHLRTGMRLIDCGCGPGSVTVDLAAAPRSSDGHVHFTADFTLLRP